MKPGNETRERFLNAIAQRVPRESIEVCLELPHRNLALIRMGTEHLVMVDPAGAEVIERSDHRAGAAGVANRGDTTAPHQPDSVARRVEELLLAAFGLDADHARNPGQER